MRKLFFLFAVLPTAILAQDTNYWTQQFGTRSALLGGAVVAGVDDNSAVFYNPAVLSQLDNSSLSINANVYKIENIRITNALGQEADFKSSQFSAIPILIGGLINLKNKDWKLGYGLMAPVDFRFRGNARMDKNIDFIDNTESPGQELLVGESEKNSQLSEIAAAVGVGKTINNNWSVGVTGLFTYRNLNYNQHLLAHSILNDAEQTYVNTTVYKYVKYYHIRFAPKLGVNYKGDQWSFGFTFTTPAIGLFGKGEVAADATAGNLKINDVRQDGIASDRQDKLSTTWKSPLSVALGIQHTTDKNLWSISAAYFGEQSSYDVIRAEPSDFVRPAELYASLGSEDFLRVIGGAKAVFNVALAYQHQLNESTSLQFSLRNDMSYLPDDFEAGRTINTNITSWNIYHFTGGTTIEREKSSITLGLLLSAGSSDEHSETSTIDDNTNEGNLLLGTTTITSANYFSFGLLLGYTFNFKKK